MRAWLSAIAILCGGCAGQIEIFDIPPVRLAPSPSSSGCIARVATGIYDAPVAVGPASDAYRIAVIDGCVALGGRGPFVGRARHQVSGAVVERRWGDGKACESGWIVQFRGFTSTITATARSFSQCGSRRDQTFAPVTLRRVAKVPGSTLSLLDHSDAQVGLAALEKVATMQSNPRAVAAIDRAIRRGAGKARDAHRAVAHRAIELATSPRLVDALVLATGSWPQTVAAALARTVRSPGQAARLIGRIVDHTASGDSHHVRAPTRALNRLLDAANRKAVIARLRKTARSADPKPALVALVQLSADREGLARFMLAGAAASRRCQQGVAFLDEARPEILFSVDATVTTGLFAALLQPTVCRDVRARAANLLASVADNGNAAASLVALAARVGRDDRDPTVRSLLSKFANP